MISRFLEKRVEIEMEEPGRKPGNTLELEYYLLENEAGGIENSSIFGVEIREKNHGVINEIKNYYNIYNNREDTLNLVRMLAIHTVTPSSLPYVLDDILGT
jgi:hypothetical protein